MSKDWTGNANAVFTTNGSKGHAKEEREKNDYYATDPIAMSMLLEKEVFNKNIWECAVGGGHLAEVLKEYGYNVVASDLIDRGYEGTRIIDFLNEPRFFIDGDIITNPPYKYAVEFVERALDSIPVGNKVAMFLKLTFLESKKRKQLFIDNPPQKIWVFTERVECAKYGVFKGTSAVAYAWFVWEKGYKGKMVVDHLSREDDGYCRNCGQKIDWSDEE